MHTVQPTVARFSKNNVCIYSEPPRRYRPPAEEGNKKPKPISQHFKGEMSDQTRKKVKRIVESWISAITIGTGQARMARRNLSKYVTFVTLTLSAKQEHTDQELKRELLNYFLINASRQFKVGEYIWVSEKQKNGNIHFHIIFDKFIHWKRVRRLWNLSQERLGYVSKFEKKHGHRNPNSTDIHALRKIKNVTGYICKYLTKEANAHKVEGRLWATTRTLARAQYFRSVADSRCVAALKFLENCGSCKVVVLEYCTFILGDIYELLKSKEFPLWQEIVQHHTEFYASLSQN